jgi:hypothetical protein
MLEGIKKYPAIPAPALVIFAIPHAQAKWISESADAKVPEAAKAYSAAEVVLRDEAGESIQRRRPNGTRGQACWRRSLRLSVKPG